MTAVLVLLVAALVLLALQVWQGRRRFDQRAKVDAALLSVLHDLRTLQMKELELRVARGQLRAGEGAARLRERLAQRESAARAEP